MSLFNDLKRYLKGPLGLAALVVIRQLDKQSICSCRQGYVLVHILLDEFNGLEEIRNVQIHILELVPQFLAFVHFNRGRNVPRRSGSQNEKCQGRIVAVLEWLVTPGMKFLHGRPDLEFVFHHRKI